MTDRVSAAAAALTQQAETIHAMRAEGERRVAAFREKAAFPTHLPDGPHWLRYKRLGSTDLPAFLADWSNLSGRWAYFGVSGTDSAERIAAECDYVGPCVLSVIAPGERTPCGTTLRLTKHLMPVRYLKTLNKRH